MGFNDLPIELTDRIIRECLRTAPASVLALNAHWHKHLLPKLYGKIHLGSIRQLRAFVDEDSGARKHCKALTHSLVINLPGNPNTHHLRSCPPGASSGRDGVGDGDGGGPLIDDVHLLKYMEHTASKYGNYHLSHIRTATFNSDWPATNSGRRAILIAETLAICGNIKTLQLELFSVQHSNVDIDFDYRRAEIEAIAEALSNMHKLESLIWRPPAPTLPTASVISEDMAAALSYGLKIAAHRAACQQANAIFLRARDVLKPPFGKSLPRRGPEWKYADVFRSPIGGSRGETTGRAADYALKTAKGHPLRHVELDFGKRSHSLDPCWELLGTLFGYQFFEPEPQGWKVSAELLSGHVLGFSSLETIIIKTSTLPPIDALFATTTLPFNTSVRLRLVDTSIGCQLDLRGRINEILTKPDLHRDYNLDTKVTAVVNLLYLYGSESIEFPSFLKALVTSWYLTGRLDGICTWLDPAWQFYLPAVLLMEVDSPSLRTIDDEAHRETFGAGVRVAPFEGDHKLSAFAPVRRSIRGWFQKNIHPWGVIRADGPWGPNAAEWRTSLAAQPEYADRAQLMAMQDWFGEEISSRIRRNVRERIEIYHTVRGDDDPSGSFATVETREDF